MLNVVSDLYLSVSNILSLIMTCSPLCWPHCGPPSPLWVLLLSLAIMKMLMYRLRCWFRMFLKQLHFSRSHEQCKFPCKAQRKCPFLLLEPFLYHATWASVFVSRASKKKPLSATPSTSASDPPLYINAQIRCGRPGWGQMPVHHPSHILCFLSFLCSPLPQISPVFLSCCPNSSHSSSPSPALSNPI